MPGFPNKFAQKKNHLSTSSKKSIINTPNDAIHLAKELAQANGFDDRIEFFQDVSTRISLPERADVIVSDLRGVLPLYGEHITSIIDAQQRHLAPGGILIPKRDAIWVSVVEAPAVYKELTTPWNTPYGLSMKEARQIALNDWIVEDTNSFNEHNLLMEPQVWTVLDYASIESPDINSAKISQKAARDGTGRPASEGSRFCSISQRKR